jgi:hypothetical protein
MMLRISRFLAIYLTALTLALTFSHLLEMPSKMQYGPALYMAVQRTLYSHFAAVGAPAEIGAVFFLVVLCIALRQRGAIFYLVLLATICVAGGLALWFALVFPANSRTAQWSGLPLPANWTVVRQRWEYGHAASAVLDLIGFGVLVLSTVLDTGEEP